LVRAVGFWALAAAIVNVTIGGSIFALPGTLAAAMGAAAPLAFTLGALLFVPIVMCFAAAGSRVTATGGPYLYVTSAFGIFPGFAIAVFFWISSVAGSGSMSAVLADQISHVFPVLGLPLPRAVFLLAVYALLFALNARGIKIGAAVILGFAAAKALPLLLLCVVGAAHVHPENLRIAGVPSWTAIGNSLVIVVFAYSGIETALAPGGEVQNPNRVVPRAALAGVAVVIALYIGLQTVAQGVLGKALAGNDVPLAAVADVIWPGAGRFLVLVATVSLVGVLQGDLLGASRVLYALARDGFLPARIATVTRRHRTPLFAVAMHSLVAWLLASVGSFAALALISGGAFCFVYMACCAAAWQLQRKNVGANSTPVRLPGGALIPLSAIAGLLGILSTLQRAEWIAIGCASLAVACLYAAARWARR
jgi:amino acid transporter